MLEKRIIPLDELAKFGGTETLNEQVKSLVSQQKSTWQVAKTNYTTLQNVQTKTFGFGHFKIIVQYNPERIRSSAAKTDAKSIAERPCFLCINNLPEEQKGITFREKYLILINPFPIFPLHLTLSKLEHVPQLIGNFFYDMLEISEKLTDFTVFYNGPKCGASAPDHFHFQAGINGMLPIESEFQNLENNFAETIFQNEIIKVFAVENYLRRFVAIVSGDKTELQKRFKEIYNILDSGLDEDPMMNVLCSFEKGEWRVIVFPREKQRPSHFFETGENQIVVGPAAVELGGVLILPRKEDFLKITKKEIEEIYGEVTINRIAFNKIITATKTLK